MTIEQEQEKPPEKRQAEGGGGGGNCEKDEDCKKGYKCLKTSPQARLGRCVPDSEHEKHKSNITVLQSADNTIKEATRTITNNRKVKQEATIKNEEDEDEVKKLEEEIRKIRLRQEAREKDLKDKEEDTKQQEEIIKKARNTYKITDQQMRNRYEKHGMQHPDDMIACPVCQEDIPDAEIEEGISNKSLLRTHCCNQIIHKDCAVNHWSDVDYSRWQRCPACQNTRKWVRLINETEGRDPNSSVSNTRDFLLDRSRRGERERRDRIERTLQVNFRIPSHDADENRWAVTNYIGDVQRPIRHRLIDYENLLKILIHMFMELIIVSLDDNGEMYGMF